MGVARFSFEGGVQPLATVQGQAGPIGNVVAMATIAPTPQISSSGPAPNATAPGGMA